ncbi:uncharacterized protein BKA55DRAFT_328074 [Fusarium redolens]|uniref:Uncharacterized protein n=1 Tax=Fusarium redolens TaxID=48865 RepID=A0A9P9HEP6_FUSRE|nr:uncharacterized protein BKA55DRAFT_328074 [Fusarium redolens]KAH7255722.1 hypothetical protein BKA55DRAFT_328074 [Fusarium redolens]
MQHRGKLAHYRAVILQLNHSIWRLCFLLVVPALRAKLERRDKVPVLVDTTSRLKDEGCRITSADTIPRGMADRGTWILQCVPSQEIDNLILERVETGASDLV